MSLTWQILSTRWVVCRRWFPPKAEASAGPRLLPLLAWMFGSQVRFAFVSKLFLSADIHSLKHFAAVDHFTTRHLLKVEQKQGVGQIITQHGDVSVPTQTIATTLMVLGGNSLVPIQIASFVFRRALMQPQAEQHRDAQSISLKLRYLTNRTVARIASQIWLLDIQQS